MEIKTGKIISLNIGKSINIADTGEREINSAIYKSPVLEDILSLTKNGLQGDEQADLVNHGGFDKALCVYPFEHYQYWKNKLNKDFPMGSFGENITLAGMLETDTNIGDIWEIGEALVQVSQPRMPCYKVAKRHDVVKLPLYIQETGYSGYYLRILKEGDISVRDRCILKKRSSNISIAYINQITYHDKANMKAKVELTNLEELAESWKRNIQIK